MKESLKDSTLERLPEREREEKREKEYLVESTLERQPQRERQRKRRREGEKEYLVESTSERAKIIREFVNVSSPHDKLLMSVAHSQLLKSVMQVREAQIVSVPLTLSLRYLPFILRNERKTSKSVACTINILTIVKDNCK